MENIFLKFIKGFLIFLVVVIIIGSFGFFVYKKITSVNLPAIKEDNTEVKSVDIIPLTFSTYKLEKSQFTPAVPNYKLSLNEISNLNSFQKSQGNFSTAQKNALVKDNFFIAQNNDKFYSTNADNSVEREDDWTSLYKKIGGAYNVWERQPENAVFITSDFALHVYHKLLDEEFSYIEEINFYPTLSDLSKKLLQQSSTAFTKETDQLKKDSYERLSSYFLVSSSILETASQDYNEFKKTNFINDSKNDSKQNALSYVESLAKANNISDSAKNIAKQEIELIFNADKMVSSPLMGKYQPGIPEDYTQFNPRSHYAKNAILRDYFRAMMFYGRMNFLLSSTELTRDGANISLLLSSDEINQWKSIYLPTAFFVGQADDLGVNEYNTAIKKTGFSKDDESDFAVIKLQEELKTYKNPQIMSSVVVDEKVLSTTKEDLQKTTKGFRFMGQRFTPDAFVFSSLTQGQELPDPVTGQRLPSTPTALMISTLMGSSESGKLLSTWITENAPNSDKVIANKMKVLQNYFNSTTEQQWTQNIYWSWLYTIKSLFNAPTDKTGYPAFEKSENWDKKNLQSFLGSWTELKHDTLLYAKQSYAEKGAGGPDEQPANPIVKGYVEPNIEFFDRLIALVTMSKDGLKSFGILPEQFEYKNETLLKSLQFYRKIALAEIQNQKITDEDFEKLRMDAGSLDYILSQPDSQVTLEKNSRSAIIADVHTDVVKGQILYEANGIPNYIYVAVKDTNGTRLTKGLVYSYYEFTNPTTKRLSDNDWQSWNYPSSSQKPQMPWWNKDLIK